MRTRLAILAALASVAAATPAYAQKQGGTLRMVHRENPPSASILEESTISVNQPKGTVDGPAQAFTVYTNDQLLSAAPWNDVVLEYRNGAPVRVRDVGVAVDAP